MPCSNKPQSPRVKSSSLNPSLRNSHRHLPQCRPPRGLQSRNCTLPLHNRRIQSNFRSYWNMERSPHQIHPKFGSNLFKRSCAFSKSSRTIVDLPRERVLRVGCTRCCNSSGGGHKANVASMYKESSNRWRQWVTNDRMSHSRPRNLIAQVGG